MSERRKLSVLKRCLFSAVLFLLVYGAIEAIAYLSYEAVTGERFGDTVSAKTIGIENPDTTQARQQAGLGLAASRGMSIHPYFGYVYTPPEPGANPGPIAISEDGWLDDKPAVRRRNKSKILVAITGGSVAAQLGMFHSQLLRQDIMNHPEHDGREVEFVRLGMPGYHQPQQLQQLTYLLAQGGELDILLNVDGFNEVAVPAALNAPKGLNPNYPMNWSIVALDVPDLNLRRHIGAVAYLEEERRRRAADFRNSIRAYSVLGRLLWRRGDRAFEQQIAEHAWEIQQFQTADLPYFIQGPKGDHDPPGGLVTHCVQVWKRSSQQMNTLCKANGIRYLQFLQPNQYLPDSKPLSDVEAENAYSESSPYKAVVEEGYPLLQKAGEELKRSGVEFVDLSLLFGDVEETLYVDSCCHYNQAGNAFLCEAIAREVVSSR